MAPAQPPNLMTGPVSVHNTMSTNDAAPVTALHAGDADKCDHMSLQSAAGTLKQYRDRNLQCATRTTPFPSTNESEFGLKVVNEKRAFYI